MVWWNREITQDRGTQVSKGICRRQYSIHMQTPRKQRVKEFGPLSHWWMCRRDEKVRWWFWRNSIDLHVSYTICVYADVDLGKQPNVLRHGERPLMDTHSGFWGFYLLYSRVLSIFVSRVSARTHRSGHPNIQLAFCEVGHIY